MMNIEYENLKSPHKRRLTTLILLVFFVFVILLISFVISGAILYFLMKIEILPPLTANRFPTSLIFMFLVSQVIGTILAVIGGNYFLRPLWSLTEATKEVASGNFNVRVETGGSREISRLAVNFNEMTKELSSIETLRNDFVSNISHEFKTPIVSIRGFARRLKKNSLTNEQRSEYLDLIIAETERLSNLSSNVLLLSKLESTDIIAEKTTYFLDEQIRRTILLLEPQFQKKRTELKLNLEPARFTGNEEMMQPLWINLLSNAIKFSPESGVIGVELRLEGNNAVVSVSDAGIGMDDEVKKHVFDKFYQGDQSRATEGNGLGLSLVNRIIKLCNGSVDVKSELGKGSEFIVSLPLRFDSEDVL